MNMQCILSSIIFFCFLTFTVNIHPVNSDQLAYDGSVESLMGTETIPESKDIVYKPEFNLSARLYLPENTAESQKLPLLVYYHGGGFIIESPFSSTYHNFLNVLVSEANVIAVSVEYRLSSPFNNKLPVAYDDSWTALEWVASHLNGDGPEDWLNQHADFQRVFLSGDSAGANIAHQMALRLGTQGTVEGFAVSGMILCHPSFWGQDAIPGETTDTEIRSAVALSWLSVCPKCMLDHPWINPATDLSLALVATPRLQVFVSELDILQERGWYYAQNLRQSGWSGIQEVIDFLGEGHVFHLKNLTSRNSSILRNRIATFINEKWSDASFLMEPSRDSSNFMVSRRALYIPKVSSET
ncbi:hypothetical protein Dsin_027049 [Dipteronia sinensis]|uniref:Alpha/beta hydrolase fold-3 domain-containing protein n=1 Tax=Dipteronia sinensis TaxID=43782 RepID=A0AAE0DZT9_9ROSI|nr:hypothetical protein Dsin_027049 [Dipteronia sinensis]